MSDEKVIWTKDEVIEHARALREMIRERFLEKGSYRPTSFLFVTVDPRTKQPAKILAQVPALGDFDDDDKEMYSTIMRSLAHEAKAVGLVFVSEVWMVVIQGEASPKDREKYAAEVERMKKEWAGRASEHPDRKEFLMVTLEHARFGTVSWLAPILRPEGDPKGKPDLGPWNNEKEGFSTPGPGPDGGNHMPDGRFTHLLPQVD